MFMHMLVKNPDIRRVSMQFSTVGHVRDSNSVGFLWAVARDEEIRNQEVSSLTHSQMDRSRQEQAEADFVKRIGSLTTQKMIRDQKVRSSPLFLTIPLREGSFVRRGLRS